MTRMDVREKLVEILKQAPFEGKVLDEWWWEEKIKRIADHLISNGVTVQEWISVRDRLPEKGEDVLVFNIRENWTGFAWLRPDETWTALGFDFPFDLGEVTHWMPLPEPPKGE